LRFRDGQKRDAGGASRSRHPNPPIRNLSGVGPHHATDIRLHRKPAGRGCGQGPAGPSGERGPPGPPNQLARPVLSALPVPRAIRGHQPRVASSLERTAWLARPVRSWLVLSAPAARQALSRRLWGLQRWPATAKDEILMSKEVQSGPAIAPGEFALPQHLNLMSSDADDLPSLPKLEGGAHGSWRRPPSRPRASVHMASTLRPGENLQNLMSRRLANVEDRFALQMMGADLVRDHDRPSSNPSGACRHGSGSASSSGWLVPPASPWVVRTRPAAPTSRCGWRSIPPKRKRRDHGYNALRRAYDTRQQTASRVWRAHGDRALCAKRRDGSWTFANSGRSADGLATGRNYWLARIGGWSCPGGPERQLPP
jgi:hypothetical protein